METSMVWSVVQTVNILSDLSEEQEVCVHEGQAFL